MALAGMAAEWVACMDADGATRDSCSAKYPSDKDICECMSHVHESTAMQFDCVYHPEHSAMNLMAHWGNCVNTAATCKAEDIGAAIDSMSGAGKENCMALAGLAAGWVECMDENGG